MVCLMCFGVASFIQEVTLKMKQKALKCMKNM